MKPLRPEADSQAIDMRDDQNYMDFPHYLITDKRNISKFLLMLHERKRNRRGKFGQLKLMH